MSKSDTNPKSRIVITDSKDEIKKKVKSALTDSTNGITYEPVTRPGVSNLVSIMYHLSQDDYESPAALAQACQDMSMRAFKEGVAAAIDAKLEVIRGSYQDILNRESGRYLEEVAEEGAVKARASAAATMEDVRAAIGL